MLSQVCRPSFHKRAMYWTVLCLPFTQAPTIKFLLRWRLSEIIAWLYLPTHIVVAGRILRKMPSTIRIAVGSISFYFAYTALIGVTASPFVEVKVFEALIYTLHPLLRSLLESARGFSALSLLIGLLLTVRSWNEFEKVLKLFCWSGAVAGAYGTYQAAVLAFSLPLPFLPGTLYREGYVRPFGTFYEPTGLGSYTAVTLLIGLYFLLRKRNLRTVGCIVLNGVGFFVSLARTGWVALLVGSAVLLAMMIIRKKKLYVSLIRLFLLGVALLGILWFGQRVSINILGSDLVAFAFSEYWVRYCLEARVDAYRLLPNMLLEFPFGFGSGLFLYYGAGAPGWIRLIVEGGIFGGLALVGLHMSVLGCLLWLWKKGPSEKTELTIFITACYIASFVVTLNYINVTDMWIWFVWGLPVVARWVAEQERGVGKG